MKKCPVIWYSCQMTDIASFGDHYFQIECCASCFLIEVKGSMVRTEVASYKDTNYLWKRSGGMSKGKNFS